MDRMIYLAMNGAKNLMQKQAVNSNNLANVNTNGFRADLQTFKSMQVEGPTYPSRVYSDEAGMGVDLTPGPIKSTGRDLDIAIRGEGYVAVQGTDGTEAYTRAGSLRVNEIGQLVTAAGHPVLGNGGPISVPPFEKMEIANDGTITIRPVGQEATTLAVVDRIKLVNVANEDIVKGEDGLLRNSAEPETPADASVQIESGYLEGSNVSAINEMVEMISLSRQYEMQVKMMSSAEENSKAAEGLMRLG